MENNLLKVCCGLLLVVFTTLGSLAARPPAPGAGLPAGMVKVPAGAYTLFYQNKAASPVPVKAFYLDARAVTNAEFLAFVKANPSWARSKVSRLYADTGYLKHWAGDFDLGSNARQISASPVTNVSWYAANAYSRWKGKRLPSLEEWEYAGQARVLHDARPLEKLILDWYGKPTPKVLPPAGSVNKNAYQVSDMHGLIWEWVADFNSVLLEGDSRSSSSLNRDLFCASGSFGASNKEDYAAFMRFAFRGSLQATYTVSNLGFRCAKNLN
ncbi:MAG: formylglycine-generating enzyme family protein [Adhaeribacter sp.]